MIKPSVWYGHTKQVILPRQMFKARAWLPLRMKSKHWVWGKTIYIESTAKKHVYYTEDEYFIESLCSDVPVEDCGVMHLYPFNPLCYILLLPIIVVLLFVVLCIIDTSDFH